MKYRARAKVISGFTLAVVLTFLICIVTYFSVKTLLETVESLSEPSNKLASLNELLAEIYQLDKAKGIIPSENDTAEFIDHHKEILDRIKKLKTLASDSLEINQINAIRHDVGELIVVYNGLDEVKNNLINRNFSREALQNIETKIKRKEELNRLESLGRIRLKSPPTPDISIRKDFPTKKNSPSNVISQEERKNMRDFFGLLKVKLERSDTAKVNANAASDSMIYAVRNFILDINNEEQQLRSRLASLESELTQKNKALIENIQVIINHLQKEALDASKEQNKSAYELTFNVSVILGVFIVIGIVGSFLFIYSIITEINKAENYSDSLEDAKKRSDNLAKAKQDFLANMSHEIRNPLHAIQGFNDALLKTDLNENQEDYVKMVGFASDTLSGIVNDILDFSKLEAGKVNIEKEPFDPIKLFTSIQQFFEFKAVEKKLTFEWKTDLPEGKWIIGDELRINQILNNLLSNAFKFTEKGKIKVKISLEGKNLFLTVEDSGLGMTEEVKNKIFTKFNQGDGSITRKFGGTGLGLAIVKKLIDLQKGTIKLESKDGVGTKVLVSIPTETTQPNVETIPSPNQNYSIEGMNILVIDDDPIGLKFVKLLLNSKGAKVTSFNGGVAFRDHFVGGKFDLALLDIQMPEISGYQVLEILRKNEAYKKLPIMAITANVFAKEKEKLQDVGFDGLVLKPFKEKDLMIQIAKVMKLTPIPKPLPLPIKVNRTASLPPYDISDIKRFCMNDEEMVEEVLIEFYSETVQNLIDINKALDREDYQKIRAIAHQLSSRLGQLKINASQIARKLEEELKINQTDKVPERVWQITKEVDEALTSLASDYKLSV